MRARKVWRDSGQKVWKSWATGRGVAGVIPAGLGAAVRSSPVRNIVFGRGLNAVALFPRV